MKSVEASWPLWLALFLIGTVIGMFAVVVLSIRREGRKTPVDRCLPASPSAV